MSLETFGVRGSEVFSIGSGVRVAPAYDETGIPIPPRKRDCISLVGEVCPVVATNGKCFSDEHHLLYSQNLYEEVLGGVYGDLFRDPLMRVTMARCRHNSAYEHAAHSMYDISAPPKRDAAHRFLDEGRILRRMSAAIAEISNQVMVYKGDSAKDRFHAGQSHVVDGKVEQLEKERLVFELCRARVDEIEVIPSTIVGRSLNELWRKVHDMASSAEHYPDEVKELVSV